MADTAQSYYRRLDIIEESTWGTTPTSAPSAYTLRCTEITPKDEQRLIEQLVYKGDRKPAMPIRDCRSCGATIKVPLFPNELGWWLKHAVGVPTTTGSGAYKTHTYKAGFNNGSEGDLHEGFSIDLGYTDLGTDIWTVLTGCRINSITIPFAACGTAEATIEVIGKAWTAHGASPYDSTPTTYTDDPLCMCSISTMSEGAVGPFTTCRNGEFRLENNLDGSLHCVNNAGCIADLPSGIARCTGRAAFLFQSATIWNKALNATESALSVTWTSGSYNLVVSVDELKYHRCAPLPGGGSALILDMEWVGYEDDDADATILKVELTNTVASY